MRLQAIAIFILIGFLHGRPAQAVVVVTLEPGASDFRIASVTGVDIGGTLYDVTHTHGGTYNAWEDANGLDFTTSASAGAAYDAWAAAVNGRFIDASLSEIYYTQIAIVPYGDDGVLYYSAYSDVDSLSPLTYPSTHDVYLDFAASDNASAPNAVDFLTFTAQIGGGATIPEPASVTLWCLLAVGAVGYRRFRSRMETKTSRSS